MEKISCAVGITLLLSSVIMSVLNLKKDKFNNFVELLNPEQKRFIKKSLSNVLLFTMLEWYWE